MVTAALNNNKKKKTRNGTDVHVVLDLLVLTQGLLLVVHIAHRSNQLELAWQDQRPHLFSLHRCLCLHIHRSIILNNDGWLIYAGCTYNSTATYGSHHILVFSVLVGSYPSWSYIPRVSRNILCDRILEVLIIKFIFLNNQEVHYKLLEEKWTMIAFLGLGYLFVCVDAIRRDTTITF